MRKLIVLVAVLTLAPYGVLGAGGLPVDVDIKAASKFALFITDDGKAKGRCACRDADDDTADNSMGILRYHYTDQGGKLRILMECWVPEYAFGEVASETMCADWVPLSK